MYHLSLKNICYEQQKYVILHDISIDCHQPELIGIIGANGSGKSTLIQILAGILRPTQGEVQLNGKSLHFFLQFPIISVLAPQWELKPHVRVCEIFTIFDHHYDKNTLGKYIEQFTLEPLLNKYFDQLSLGEQSRVLLARTLAIPTPIVLLDEPFANLDLEQENLFWQILQKEAKNRLILISSHNLPFCAYYAHKLLLLKTGELVAYNSSHLVFTEDNLNTAWNSSNYRLQHHPDRPSHVWLCNN